MLEVVYKPRDPLQLDAAIGLTMVAHLLEDSSSEELDFNDIVQDAVTSLVENSTAMIINVLATWFLESHMAAARALGHAHSSPEVAEPIRANHLCSSLVGTPSIPAFRLHGFTRRPRHLGSRSGFRGQHPTTDIASHSLANGQTRRTQLRPLMCSRIRRVQPRH